MHRFNSPSAPECVAACSAVGRSIEVFPRQGGTHRGEPAGHIFLLGQERECSRLHAMHPSSSPSTARRSSLLAIVSFAATTLPLLGAGCATEVPAGRARFACYDVRGRLADTVVTQAECELRNWEWRERP
jgi:hypothetical protein